MQYETITQKDPFVGWKSETIVPLGVKTEEGDMQLRISTLKRSGGALSTVASVAYAKPDGSFSFMVFEDYSRTLLSAKTRVTEKACKQFHEDALKLLPSVLKDVEKQYGINLERIAA